VRLRSFSFILKQIVLQHNLGREEKGRHGKPRKRIGQGERQGREVLYPSNGLDIFVEN
jgi:hypothetical protein